MTKEEVLAKLKFEVELRGFSKRTRAEYYTKVTMLGSENIRIHII